MWLTLERAEREAVSFENLNEQTLVIFWGLILLSPLILLPFKCS